MVRFARRMMLPLVLLLIVPPQAEAGARAGETRVAAGDFEGACPAFIDRSGGKVGVCVAEVPDEGPVSYSFAIYDVPSRRELRSFDVGLEPTEPEGARAIREINGHLKKEGFARTGRALGNLSSRATFGADTVAVTIDGQRYVASLAGLSLARGECCEWSGLTGATLFADKGILAATLGSTCRDNEDEDRPCPCDGSMPMDDEEAEDYEWCPSGTSEQIFLRPAPAAPAAPAPLPAPGVVVPVPDAPGLSDDWRREHPECTDAKRVTVPDPSSPEAVILDVFRAALEPDTEEAFQHFYATLDADMYDEPFARRQLWPRLRQHVASYVEGPDDPSYVLCRTVRKEGRDDYLKIFVFSKVRTKSHPPIAFVRKDDRWIIEFFNY